MGRIICWFSCGAASAVATRLTLRDHPDAMAVYCETGAEHEDSKRFMADCVRWFNAPITSIRSDEYADTWDVWEKTRWLAGIKGARCTTELKVKPRLAFQRPTDTHVFGYTADGPDVKRAKQLRENYPELTIWTPLIDAGLDKSAVLAMVQSAGIVLPIPYTLGFHNNNCKTCVKATSPDYWALVRKSYPEDFARMAKLSRSLDVRLSRINDERIFIDEIPADQPTTNPIQPACDFPLPYRGTRHGESSMTATTAPTIRFDIFIAGDLARAKQTCRSYCFGVGLCVTVEPATYIYTGGEEEGVRVGLINYPRFPADHETLQRRARELAHQLMHDLFQHSYSIVGPETTEWFSRRPA